jgi:hypothetical protein
MSEITLFFIGQSAVILLSFAAGYVGIKVQIAKLEVHVTTLRSDHKSLASQIQGISRSVSELHGKVHDHPT